MEQPAPTDHLANCEIPGDEVLDRRTLERESLEREIRIGMTDQTTFRRGANFAPAPGRKKEDNLGFEYAEHSYLGDVISLTLSDGRTVTAIDHPLTLENGLTITYGQINGLAGDFYGTMDPISDGSNDAEQAARFVNAYDTLANRHGRQPAVAKEIVKLLKREIDVVNDALDRHQNPSVAYNSLPNLPNQTLRFQLLTSGDRSAPSYLDLALINWDHLGEDARTAYNAGHSKTLDVAVAGDLERAYTMNAFADHFLEDSFSAGHLRTPRRYLHSSGLPLPALDYCAKLMHDEDNAIGLRVGNPAGEIWMVYGDKRGLDVENEDNKNRCLAALQVSVDEIYNAWKTKTKPSKVDYGAWTHTPMLKYARGFQALAPLFQNKARRRSLKSRGGWFFSDWDSSTTISECLWSGLWEYSITMNGPGRTPSGSDDVATATSSSEV